MSASGGTCRATHRLKTAECPKRRAGCSPTARPQRVQIFGVLGEGKCILHVDPEIAQFSKDKAKVLEGLRREVGRIAGGGGDWQEISKPTNYRALYSGSR